MSLRAAAGEGHEDKVRLVTTFECQHSDLAMCVAIMCRCCQARLGEHVPMESIRAAVMTCLGWHVCGRPDRGH